MCVWEFLELHVVVWLLVYLWRGLYRTCTVWRLYACPLEIVTPVNIRLSGSKKAVGKYHSIPVVFNDPESRPDP